MQLLKGPLFTWDAYHVASSLINVSLAKCYYYYSIGQMAQLCLFVIPLEFDRLVRVLGRSGLN